MLLTPRAESLLPPLRASVQSVGAALAPPPTFEPAQADINLRIMIPDLLAPFLPGLTAALTSVAPKLSLEFLPVPPELPDALKDTPLSLAVAPEQFADAATMKRSLDKMRFGVVARKRHPAVGSGLDLDTWLSYRHVVVSRGSNQSNVIEEWLAKRRLQRKVGLRVPSFLAGLLAVADSDLLMNAPQPLAKRVTDQLGLIVQPAPVRLPTVPLSLMWHPRVHEYTPHAWARGKVHSYFQEALRQ